VSHESPLPNKEKLVLNSNKRIIAVVELILIFPAVLFLEAVGLRAFQPIQYESAHTAQTIFNWY
jgi:hypothetical protein